MAAADRDGFHFCQRGEEDATGRLQGNECGVVQVQGELLAMAVEITGEGRASVHQEA